jgi:hypothetical protein
MSKKTVDTTYIYERLNKEEVLSYMESKDITDNERDGFHTSIKVGFDLFKTIRFGKNIVVGKNIADKLIAADKSMLMFRSVIYSILLLVSFGLFVLALFIPQSQQRTIDLSDILFAGLTFGLIICAFSLFYENLKDTKKLIISKDRVNRSTSILNEDVNIEIRKTTL